ncbi:unnamed protein product [Trifolium pratense]|uniref:Uncharacterized protein n=1 Tax=Trifolium pratense TaxID=57577 RepID=A0ACB0L1K8_TRIPR|nr:unnamed protein product [Trifolium pratense]
MNWAYNKLVGSVPVEDPALFRSIVGALHYVTLTIPEIAYYINKVCQFLSNPLEEHWKAVKRILRYLSGTDVGGFLLYFIILVRFSFIIF